MGGKGKEFMEMMGSQDGKMPEMVQEMMAEKEGLCLSQDEVFTDFLIAMQHIVHSYTLHYN